MGIYQEDEVTELKREYTEELDKEIIAFLNAAGGTIYIGINDDGTINPLTDGCLDNINLKISSIITDSIYPTPRELIDMKTDKDGILEIEIKEGTQKPYYLRGKGPKPSGTYIRYGTSKRQATEEKILTMIMDSRKLSFESETSKIQKLRFEYLKIKSSTIEFELDDMAMVSLGLKNVKGEYTNLGLLLSDENPVMVKFAKYDKKMDFLIKKEFEGSILRITDQILEQCELLNITSAVIPIHQAQRIETKSYPGVSLREAVLNAICHADYMEPSNIKNRIL